MTHREFARDEPIDFCASMEMQAARIRPKAPPSAFALPPNMSRQSSPWSPRSHKRQRGQQHACQTNARAPILPNSQKPPTDARGSRANILRRSPHVGSLSMRSVLGMFRRTSPDSSKNKFGSSRPTYLAAESSLLKTGSERRVLGIRTIKLLRASSGE